MTTLTVVDPEKVQNLADWMDGSATRNIRELHFARCKDAKTSKEYGGPYVVTAKTKQEDTLYLVEAGAREMVQSQFKRHIRRITAAN